MKSKAILVATFAVALLATACVAEASKSKAQFTVSVTFVPAPPTYRETQSGGQQSTSQPATDEHGNITITE